MMSAYDWSQAIRRNLEQIADVSYQRKAWFGQGPAIVSSPEEMICQLVDDFSLNDFLMNPEVDLAKGQRDAGLRLVAAIERFCATTPDVLEPTVVIDDARWTEVTRLANEFLSALASVKGRNHPSLPLLFRRHRPMMRHVSGNPTSLLNQRSSTGRHDLCTGEVMVNAQYKRRHA